MTDPPINPLIYHITHLSNLESIVRAGVLWSDAQRHARGFPHQNVGLLHIKQRRLQRPVKIAGIDHGKLGEYVPFNFCNRSVMLYVLARGHDNYSGGQDEILHLVSSVDSAIATGRRWAFTDRHADLAYARYFNRKADLKEIDWPVMPQKYWSEGDTKEKRQAEFLLYEQFPWTSIERIVAKSDAVAAAVKAAVLGVRASNPATHCPPVNADPSWYY